MLQTTDRQQTAATQLQQQATAVTSLHFGLRVKYDAAAAAVREVH